MEHNGHQQHYGGGGGMHKDGHLHMNGGSATGPSPRVMMPRGHDGAASPEGEPPTRWHYRGPDGIVYGPYTGLEMVDWHHQGYFTESLLMRTTNEAEYHALGEWHQLCGSYEFFVLSPLTFDMLYNAVRNRHIAAYAQMQQMQQAQGQPQQMAQVPHPQSPPQQFLYPPGLPPPHGANMPPQVFAISHARFAGGPQHYANMPPGAPLMHGANMTGSEHAEASPNNSQSPDSEEEYVRYRQQQQQQQQHHFAPVHHLAQQFGQAMHLGDQHQNMMMHEQHQAESMRPEELESDERKTLGVSIGVDTGDAPWLRAMDAFTNTEGGARSHAQTQTLPVMINSKEAARILSEAIGMHFIIN